MKYAFARTWDSRAALIVFIGSAARWCRSNFQFAFAPFRSQCQKFDIRSHSRQSPYSRTRTGFGFGFGFGAKCHQRRASFYEQRESPFFFFPFFFILANPPSSAGLALYGTYTTLGVAVTRLNLRKSASIAIWLYLLAALHHTEFQISDDSTNQFCPPPSFLPN